MLVCSSERFQGCFFFKGKFMLIIRGGWLTSCEQGVTESPHSLVSEAWVPLTEAETKWKSERETSLSFRQPRECTIVTETPNAWKVFIKEENDNYRYELSQTVAPSKPRSNVPENEQDSWPFLQAAVKNIFRPINPRKYKTQPSFVLFFLKWLKRV